jgi:hypothetical protein
MKGLKPFPLIGLSILFCAIMSGCSSHAPANGPNPLTVDQFTLAQGAIGVPYRQLLIASGGQTPYTWTISSGSLPAGLTLQSSGVVSGTPTQVSGVTYPNTSTFTATVTDSQTPTAAFNTVTSSITINPVLTFPPATLAPGVAGGEYSATVTAANGVSPYSYTVVFGSLPDGLTLISSGTMAGTINGVPTTAGTFNFTIQATDSVSETATESFSITITGKLQGGYTISLNGFLNGMPFYLAGSFVADGNGNITSGVLDQDGPTSVVTNSPFTGTYTLPPGNNLGSMTLNTAMGPYSFNLALTTTGGSQIILLDTNRYGSGVLKAQTATTITSSGVTYAFGLFGNDAAGKRYASAGAFAINSLLAVTGGEEDTNDDGTPVAKVAITGGSLSSLDATTGRGTATLTTAAGTTNYAYYVVSSTELIAVETDNAPLALLDMLQQGAAGTTGGGSISNTTLDGQALMQLNALNPNGGTPTPDVSVGIATFDGAGKIARNPPKYMDGLPGFFTDENNGGTLTQNAFSGTYNVDPTCGPLTSACGRVTVTGIGAYQPVWYLVGDNRGFVVGTDPSVTSGSFQQQSGAPFFLGNLLGSFLGGTSDPVLSSVTNEVDAALTPPPGGLFLVNYETSGPNGPQGQQKFLGPYNCGNLPGSAQCNALGALLGRFVVTTSDPSAPQVMVLYVLGSGASGITGSSKTGLVGLSVGTFTGTPETNPRVLNYGR